MLAFFPGEVRVLTPSPGVLRILYPMDVIAAFAFAFSFAFVVFMSRLAYKWKGNFPWLGIVLGPVLFWFCLDMLCYRGTLTLSVPTQTVTLDQRSFYYHQAKTYPLTKFDRAVAESGSSWNRRLVLITSTGQSLEFGNGFTGRSGIDHAAYVVNAFLSRRTQP